MADYIKMLKGDLVEQFRDKPNIEALYDVIGKQLNDLFLFFEQLRTQRSVDASVGKQLDGVGDIVVMSRLEAAQLDGTASASTLEDERYRKYLIYKILKNTCDCTYYDIIKAFQMFWDKPLVYSEDPEVPATMLFETGDLSPEDNASMILSAPFIKAAGVAINIVARTVTPEMRTAVPVAVLMGRGYQTTTLPEIEVGIDLDDTARTIPAAQNITQTILPEMEV